MEWMGITDCADLADWLDGSHEACGPRVRPTLMSGGALRVVRSGRGGEVFLFVVGAGDTEGGAKCA